MFVGFGFRCSKFLTEIMSCLICSKLIGTGIGPGPRRAAGFLLNLGLHSYDK